MANRPIYDPKELCSNFPDKMPKVGRLYEDVEEEDPNVLSRALMSACEIILKMVDPEYTASYPPGSWHRHIVYDRIYKAEKESLDALRKQMEYYRKYGTGYRLEDEDKK